MTEAAPVSQPASRRDDRLDLMRVAAAFAVVWLHTAADVVIHKPSISSFGWWVGNLADAGTQWCVPVFVMLSGALIFPRSRTSDPIRFVAARLPRLVLATVFWSAVYIAFTTYTGPKVSLDDRIHSVLIGVPYVHLWYMYMIVGLYLFAPVIQRAADALSMTSKLAYVAGLFVLAAIADYTSCGETWFVFMFLPYIPYFVLGQILFEHPLRTPRWTKLAMMLGLGAVIAAATGLMLGRFETDAWDLTYSSFDPLVIGMSIFAFSWLLDVRLKLPLRRIADLTFGVYLIHPIFLILAHRQGVTAFAIPPLFGIPLLAVAVFLLSAASTALIARVPGLRKVV